MELLAQRQALGAGSLAQALAWAHARCPGTGARPLATLLVLNADPRAQPLLQPQTYGAEPQVQPLAQPQLLAPDTEPRAQLLVQAQKHGAEPQPMAVQWGTQLEAFAEKLAAVQRG
ncbi:hypothetical protein CYMTET_54470 [Cymbomonas tetramitiformis]|uniref:Uncharacterized protein n=1 Tax=Cymbomonas tetramitiformis TaxID=36881 RepID=A0AAE0BEV9_9CHLO|nr:hypothetical protein CYMTET_54470 [Cymbomonas tetramitiformis]